jgi:hypothetical protein
VVEVEQLHLVLLLVQPIQVVEVLVIVILLKEEVV